MSANAKERPSVFRSIFLRNLKKSLNSRNQIDLLITFANSQDHCFLLLAIHLTLYSSKGGKSIFCNSSASENVVYVSNYPIMLNTSI